MQTLSVTYASGVSQAILAIDHKAIALRQPLSWSHIRLTCLEATMLVCTAAFHFGSGQVGVDDAAYSPIQPAAMSFLPPEHGQKLEQTMKVAMLLQMCPHIRPSSSHVKATATTNSEQAPAPSTASD